MRQTGRHRAGGILICLLTCLLLLPAVRGAQPADPAGGKPLLTGDPGSFTAYGAGPDMSVSEVTPVVGQPFSRALRLTTIKEPHYYYDYGATTPLTEKLHTGDVLWVSFWARRVTTRRESGEAQVEVALLQNVDGKEVRPLQRRLAFGPNWTRFTLPFLVSRDADEGKARLAFRYGYGPQSIEIGGLRLLNFEQSVKLTDLPRTVVRYEGWAADAPWRKAAQARIEKYRKGPLTVRVVDGQNRPVSGALVQVRMQRHAFAWGTAIDERRINDRTNPENARYRQVVETYFNKVVIENDLKWGRWSDPKNRAQALAALPWIAEHDLSLRGHVLLWPSWQHSPVFLAGLKNDPEALKKAIADHIRDETTTIGDRAKEWDVANETYRHHDLLDILGRDALADWFKQAHAGAPNAKLFYNDYTMFQPGEGSQYFYDTVKFLKDSGAPIGAIGEQGHFGSIPPGIPDVLATLDKFATLGLPIQISEFDIDTDDPGLQKDFVRDFMTAVFSHPAVMGVVQWGFWEKAHWLPRAALWDADWNLRPHGQAWVDLTTKTWWTNADGKTAKDGTYQTRGFYGDYNVAVTQGAKSRMVKVTLAPTKGVLTITLP